MPVEIYPSAAKIKRNGVFQNLPAFVSESDDNAAQQMIATAENSNVAQYKHEVGDYFRLNDVLYETTNTINIGDNIVVGTNCKVAVLANKVSILEKDTSNLKESISELNEEVIGSVPFQVDVDFKKNAYITTSGDEVSYSGYNCSDYVSLSGYQKIIMTGPVSERNNPYNALYDGNKTFISNFNSNEKEIEIPSNAVYARFSYNANAYTYDVTLVANSQNALLTRMNNIEEIIGEQQEIDVNFKRNAYITANGAEAPFSGWNASDYVDVTGYSYLAMSGTQAERSNPYNAFYDDNKTFISNFDSNEKIVDIPNTAKYVRLSYNAVSYTYFGVLYSENSIVIELEKHEKRITELEQLDRNNYDGYKILAYGDSLVEQGGWQDVVKNRTQATMKKMGIGGTTIANRNIQCWVDSDGQYLAPSTDPQPTGGILCWDAISGHPVNAENTTDRISLIPTDTNIILVEFGTNDLHQNIAIGSWDDTTNDSFKGAMKLCVQRIRARIQTAKIIFITPTCERTDFVNSLELHKSAYVEAILEAPLKLNVPVIDLWSLTSWDSSVYSNYSADDIHWNNTGKQIVGEIVSGYLLSVK